MSLLIVVLAIGLGYVVWRFYQERQIRTVWLAAADQLGFSAAQSGPIALPEIAGSLDGMSVKVRVRRDDDQDMDYTVYEVTYAAVGPPLHIEGRERKSRLERKLGRSSVQVGDPFFDDQVVIRTGHASDVREFLTPARQAAVLQILGSYPKCEIQQNLIVVETDEMEADGQLLSATVRRIVDVAQVLRTA